MTHSFVDNIILQRHRSQAETQQNGRYVFFDAVAEDARDREALRGQLLNVLLAGRDTTACLLSWIFHLLARHPQVLARLNQEIKAVAGMSKEVTRSELKSMPYLANVIKESKSRPQSYL